VCLVVVLFAHVGKDKCKSLDLHTTPCMFLGYPDDYKGWRLWDPHTKCIIILHNVIWNKNKLPGTSTTPVPLLSVIQDEPDTEEVSPGKGSTEPVGEDFCFTPVIPPVSHPSTPPPVKQEMPEATPHPFFTLQSPTPAPSPIWPTQPPEPTSPMPTPEPGPSNPQ
jgi:hypothetical protein